jgi:hypothetical protein
MQAFFSVNEDHGCSAFVLRDGFDFCEWEVGESLAAKTDAARHGTISNDDVRRAAGALIEFAHARRRKQAARMDAPPGSGT